VAYEGVDETEEVWQRVYAATRKLRAARKTVQTQRRALMGAAEAMERAAWLIEYLVSGSDDPRSDRLVKALRKRAAAIGAKTSARQLARKGGE